MSLSKGWRPAHYHNNVCMHIGNAVSRLRNETLLYSNLIQWKNKKITRYNVHIPRECERIKGETEERTKANKETTDRRFLERIGDIEFNQGELELQRGEVCLELEALDVYKMRLIDCLNSLQENALNQCKKCIILRWVHRD